MDVVGPGARADRLPHRVPHRDARHRDPPSRLRALRALVRRAPHPADRRAGRRSPREDDVERDPEPPGARFALRLARGRRLRGDDRRRERARRGSRRERDQGEEADQHARRFGRRDRAPHSRAPALPRPGARVHPRGRVRRGDALRHPPAEGRALRAAPPDGGEPQGTRARSRLSRATPARPRRAAARPAGRRGRATGKSLHHTPATTTVAIPPITTAGTAPISAAATPDSNAPSSFEALMKTISTAFTRPRTSSGVTSGRIVERRTTLTRSKAPPKASASMDSHIWRERPKTTMHAPKPATTTNSVGPARRRTG